MNRYQAEFNNMTDEEIERETQDALRALEEAEDWIESVAEWVAAGKPRDKK